MRLWSINPKYLDSKGLIALWREGLLAKKVLQNKTKGYKNHPQLIRFKTSSNPIAAINKYLNIVYEEALKRGYSFDKRKLGRNVNYKDKIKINDEQIKYEFDFLKGKLIQRSYDDFKKIKNIKEIKVNPLFLIQSGPIESWEKRK